MNWYNIFYYWIQYHEFRILNSSLFSLMNSWYEFMIMNSYFYDFIYVNSKSIHMISCIWIHVTVKKFMYLFRIFAWIHIHVFIYSWIPKFISFMNLYRPWIHMIISYMNSYLYEFTYKNSYINSCKLWIHMIISNMNSFSSWSHIWIRGYKGSRWELIGLGFERLESILVPAWLGCTLTSHWPESPSNLVTDLLTVAPWLGPSNLPVNHEPA